MLGSDTPARDNRGVTGPFIFVVLCLAVAFAAVLPLLVQRRPEEGWLRWIRDSFRSLRSPEEVDVPVRDTSLAQLLREGDPEALGYTTPSELRENLHTTRSAIRR